MTNDESEIRRLVHATARTLLLCCGWSPCKPHSPDCDRIDVAIRTVLAAEREQHARDVVDARAETWRGAAKVAGNAILDRRNDISDFGLGVKHSARLLFSECKRKGEEVARAQALNDSRPPSGINQGSGAGEAECVCHRVAGGVDWWCPAHVAMRAQATATPPSPASPTGETLAKRRDCIHGLLTCEACQWVAGYPREVLLLGRRTGSAPASAPGGAPGVETCGTCGGTACMGTTPTPGTETPTGGPSAPTTGGRGRG